MACGATLKRRHDFDCLLSPTSKAQGHNCPSFSPSKRARRSLPLRPTEVSTDALSVAKLTKSTGSSQSPFKLAGKEVAMKPEHVLKNIYDEYKKIKHRKQLLMQSESHVTAKDIPSTSSSNAAINDIISSTVVTKRLDTEIPLLTIKQVGMICERLLKEQEEKLSSEYEKVLVTKLSEQYDAFVKFNYDQIQRRFHEQPASYVS